MSDDEETVKAESQDTCRSTLTRVLSPQQQQQQRRQRQRYHHHSHHHHPQPRRSSSGGSVFVRNSDSTNSMLMLAAAGPLDRQRTLTPGVRDEHPAHSPENSRDDKGEMGSASGREASDNGVDDERSGSEEKSRSTVQLLTSTGSSGSVFEPFDHESTHPLPHPYEEFGSPRLSRRSIDVDEEHLPFLSLASPTPPSPPPTATSKAAPKLSHSSLQLSHTRPQQQITRDTAADSDPHKQKQQQRQLLQQYQKLLEGRSHLDAIGEHGEEGDSEVARELDMNDDPMGKAGPDEAVSGDGETEGGYGWLENSETTTCADTLTPRPSPPRSPLPSPKLSEREASMQAQTARLQLWERRLAQREQELLVREAALVSKEERHLKPKRLSRVFSSGDLSCSLSSSTSSSRMGHRMSFSKLVE